MLIMNELTCLYYKSKVDFIPCREMQHWKRYALSFAVVMVAVAHLVGAQVNLTELMTSYLSVCGLGYSCSDWSPSHHLPHTDTQEVPTVSRVLVWWHLLRAKKLLSGQVFCENIYKIQIRCCKFSSETPTELYRAWRVCCCWLLSPTKQDVIQPRMWNRGNSLLQIDQPPCDLFDHKRIISESQMCFLSRRIREKPHWLEFKCWLRRLLEKKDHFLSVFLWGGHGLRTNVVMRSSLLSPGHNARPPEDAVTSVTAVPNSL